MGATRSSDDLSEAERYYKERLNTRNTKINSSNSVNSSIMIFPMEENIEQGIHKIYKRLIDKDQSLIRDFDQAISQYEKTLSPEKLSFTYKLSPNQGQFVYSPTKISTAGSLLVDQRKITGNSNLLKDFHTRITNGHYLKP